MIKYERRGDAKVCTLKIGAERRQHRRHDLDEQGVHVERFDGEKRAGKPFGTLQDISAGGIRVRTTDTSVRADSQLRIRLSLPAHAGISPFVDTAGPSLAPKREWVGWMTVRRVEARDDGDLDVAGPLVDMEEVDRGMLGLYLSTMPLAA